MSETKSDIVLEVKGLKKYFNVKKGIFGIPQIVKAVDGVNLTVKINETHGMVGESGCGKTTLGRTIVRIYDPTEGQIIFKGKDITKTSNQFMIPIRKSIQMIFQDPYASLNPRLTVGEIIKEPLNIHKMYSPAEREEKVQEMLRFVGLMPDHIRRYPHEFSGGQRQRIGIARAIILEPELIVCDEPISALDVSIQAQIINLLEKLRDEKGLSYLFIAHDLSMVKYISHRISVMYLGHIVETGSSDDIYKNPVHPYTKALLSAVPVPDPKIAKNKTRMKLYGEIPSPINPPPGCPFFKRCQYAKNICEEEIPQLEEKAGRKVACHIV